MKSIWIKKYCPIAFFVKLVYIQLNQDYILLRNNFPLSPLSPAERHLYTMVFSLMVLFVRQSGHNLAR